MATPRREGGARWGLLFQRFRATRASRFPIYLQVLHICTLILCATYPIYMQVSKASVPFLNEVQGRSRDRPKPGGENGDAPA